MQIICSWSLRLAGTPESGILNVEIYWFPALHSLIYGTESEESSRDLQVGLLRARTTKSGFGASIQMWQSVPHQDICWSQSILCINGQIPGALEGSFSSASVRAIGQKIECIWFQMTVICLRRFKRFGDKSSCFGCLGFVYYIQEYQGIQWDFRPFGSFALWLLKCVGVPLVYWTVSRTSFPFWSCSHWKADCW